MKEESLEFMAVEMAGFQHGVGVLDPTFHEYEDAYADGYVKVTDYRVRYDMEKSTYIEEHSRITTCKVNESSRGLFFTHKGKRYYLDDME